MGPGEARQADTASAAAREAAEEPPVGSGNSWRSRYEELLGRYRDLERQRDALRALAARYRQRFRDQEGRQSYRLARALSTAKREPAQAWRVPFELLKLLVPWSVRSSLSRGLARVEGEVGRAEARLLDRAAGWRGRVTAAVQSVWPADRPLVTVIVPCFNYGAYVEQAVDSVLRQTLEDVEVLLIEAGSTDGTTAAVVTALERPRLRKLFQPRPTSLGQNRLDGLGQARGKYVVFLDADDLLAPTYLEKALLALELTGADLAYPSVQLFGDQRGVWEPAPEFTLENVARGVTIPGVAMFSIETWSRLGLGYGTEIRAVEDWDFWLRFATRGATGRRIAEPLMLYRKHGISMSEEFDDEKDAQTRGVLEAHRAWLSPVRVARVSEKQRRPLRAANPLANLARVTRRDVPGPWIAVSASALEPTGGEHRLLSRLLASPELQPAQLLLCATGASADGAQLPFPTEEVFELSRFLDPDLFAPAMLHLLRSRDARLLVLAGASRPRSLVPMLRAELPLLKVVDLLVDPDRHLEENRALAPHLAMTVVARPEVAQMLRARGEERVLLLPGADWATGDAGAPALPAPPSELLRRLLRSDS